MSPYRSPPAGLTTSPDPFRSDLFLPKLRISRRESVMSQGAANIAVAQPHGAAKRAFPLPELAMFPWDSPKCVIPYGNQPSPPPRNPSGAPKAGLTAMGPSTPRVILPLRYFRPTIFDVPDLTIRRIPPIRSILKLPDSTIWMS
jgi:hypothetical protein